MRKYILLFIYLLFTFYSCSQEDDIVNSIKKIQTKYDFMIFNTAESDYFNILILTDSTYQNILLIAHDKLDIFYDYVYVNSNFFPFSPAFFIKEKDFTIVIENTVYYFNYDIKKFQVIQDTNNATVYMDKGFIYTQSASPEIRYMKIDSKSLEVVEEGFGSGIDDVLSKFKYSSPTGDIREAKPEEKKVIKSTLKNILELIGL